jgi:hypothetical protein
MQHTSSLEYHILISVVPAVLSRVIDASLVEKLLTTQVKQARYVLWFSETKSIVTVNRRYQNQFHKDPPTKKIIYKLEK